MIEVVGDKVTPMKIAYQVKPGLEWHHILNLLNRGPGGLSPWRVWAEPTLLTLRRRRASPRGSGVQPQAFDFDFLPEGHHVLLELS